MKTDIQTFYSSIKPVLMRKTLFKGTLIGSVAMVPIFYAYLYLHSTSLSHWGLLIFLFGIGLLTFGMLPYKRLTYLEKHPHKVVIGDDERLIYFQNGKKFLTFPFSAIEQIAYYEHKSNYGIVIKLKKKPKDKIIIHHRWFNSSNYQCDIFLPHFSQRTCSELQARLDDIVHFD